MKLNFALFSLLLLALGASAASFSNPAFCNPAGADPADLRVCFVNPSRQTLFENFTSGLNVVYSADKEYVLVTMNYNTYEGMLDSMHAIYTLTKTDNRCTDVKIVTNTRGSWRKQVCNGDDVVIMGV
ncbi:hypothetical protein PSEUBRA_001269 [Kalmanozyma brasiliensis GHG001]|uniref:uncharacterized protein n=1 Tax=Kalmanozyma brasiliensis (strain GHG001) TaxID=1365824 RepID=UPI002867F085|nr:uncharacterized protein PSEUBRA_001269 [Kalmanozyma brasiliensis GHG001]KAF6766913.1 hypothetical protein PSEUBRA_001269 [Kalmanozyma brasiliensis GHG001]